MNTSVYSHSDSDGSSHKTPSAKPKREPNLLSSPSATRIAAQRRSRRIAGLTTPKPNPEIESKPQESNPGETKTLSKIPAHKLPPKKRPRNTREKYVSPSATPAVTPAKNDPGPSNGHVKSNVDADTNMISCQVDIVFKGLPKFKKARKFTCTVCKAICDTQAGLNAHHIKHHAPVVCSTCNKQFLTPFTLARHRYSHSSLKFKCDSCGQRFPSFVCHHKNCGRSYFSNGELLKHIKVHTGKTWYCPEDNCDYWTKDKRLLGQHGRKHSDAKPYVCGVCSKGQRYHVQYVRHVENDNCEASTAQ